MAEFTRTPRPLSAVRVVRGAGYVTASTLVDRLLTIGTTIVLVRIVSPSTIGVVILATTVTEVLALLRPGGTGFSLIHQGHRSGELLRSALLIQGGLGVIAWVLQLSLATLIASVFQKPDLASVLIVLSFTHLPSAVLIIVQAMLSIDFQFGRLSWVTLAPALIGSSGQVMFALAGGGAEGISWGRVLGQYGGVVLGIVLIGSSRLMAGRFSWSAVKEIIRFGKHVFAADSLSYLNHNLDYLLLGRLVSSASLGAYGMAYNMAMLPISTINVIAGRLMMPMFADAQGEPRLLKERGKTALLLTGLICLPMTAAIAIPAPMIVDYVLGDGWSEAVLPLRLLAIYAGVRSVSSLGGVAANAIGHPEVVARFNYMYTPVSLVAIAWGAQFGIVGVAAATALVSSIASMEFLRRCYALIHVDWREIIQCLRPGVLAGLGVVVMQQGLMLSDVDKRGGLLPLVVVFLAGLAGFGGSALLDPASRAFFGIFWNATKLRRSPDYGG
jgi:O-antigen/teichoic acid export membrane protein